MNVGSIWQPLVVASLVILGGCGERHPVATSADAASQPSIISAPKTAEEWRLGLTSAYSESQSRDEGDGITSFVACFPKNDGGKCGTFAFGRRDAFRKARSFTTSDAQLWWSLGDQSLLPSVYVPDCGTPLFMLRTRYFSKDGYLIMRRVVVLADGEVVIDRDFSNESVYREPHAAGVMEAYTFPSTAADIAVLRALPGAKKALVRITGDKGYVSLKKDELQRFVGEAKASLIVYDALQAATSANSTAVCK